MNHASTMLSIQILMLPLDLRRRCTRVQGLGYMLMTTKMWATPELNGDKKLWVH